MEVRRQWRTWSVHRLVNNLPSILQAFKQHQSEFRTVKKIIDTITKPKILKNSCCSLISFWKLQTKWWIKFIIIIIQPNWSTLMTCGNYILMLPFSTVSRFFFSLILNYFDYKIDEKRKKITLYWNWDMTRLLVFSFDIVS